MDSKNIVNICLFSVIGIILFSSILIPIIDSTMADKITFDNSENSWGTYGHYDMDDPYILEYSSSMPSTAVINGQQTPLFDASMVAFADNWAIRFGTGGQFFEINGATPELNRAWSSPNQWTLTAIDGNITIQSDSSETMSLSYTDLYCVSKDGDLSFKAMGQRAYLLEDSPIFYMGLYTIEGAYNNLIQIDGTLKDLQVSNITPTYQSGEISNVVVDYNKISTRSGLYSVGAISFDVVTSQNTTPCVFDYYLVPSEVIVEGEGTPSYLAPILYAIPVVGIVGVLVGIVWNMRRT